MKFFSMFSGIGGFDLALEREGHECIGCSDIDKYANAVYAKHWPEVKNYGDATKINARELPDFDLLVGGFPCQSFSLAGKRKGFDDQRGTLFFEIARVAEIKRPTHLLLENVKGLLSAQQGYCFASILQRLDELGYCIEWQVLNGKWFIPQNRERVFIHCFRKGSGRALFPIAESNPNYDKKVRKTQNNELWLRESVAKTITTKQFEDIDANFVLSNKRIRYSTPIECERLQGFPDDWTKGASDSQRYKMLGNAVMVDCVQAIAKQLKN